MWLLLLLITNSVYIWILKKLQIFVCQVVIFYSTQRECQKNSSSETLPFLMQSWMQPLHFQCIKKLQFFSITKEGKKVTERILYIKLKVLYALDHCICYCLNIYRLLRMFWWTASSVTMVQLSFFFLLFI